MPLLSSGKAPLPPKELPMVLAVSCTSERVEEKPCLSPHRTHFSSKQRNVRDSKLVLLAALFHQRSLKDFTCWHISNFSSEGPRAYFWELSRCSALYFFVLGNPSCSLPLPQVSRNSVQPPAQPGPPPLAHSFHTVVLNTLHLPGMLVHWGTEASPMTAMGSGNFQGVLEQWRMQQAHFYNTS